MGLGSSSRLCFSGWSPNGRRSQQFIGTSVPVYGVSLPPRHPAQGSEPASRPVVRTRQFHQLGTKDVAPYALAIIFLAVLLVDLYEFAVVRGHRRFTFGVSGVLQFKRHELADESVPCSSSLHIL